MKILEKKYTSAYLKAEDEKKPAKEQTEAGKIELSNDAFAVCEFIEYLVNKLEHLRASFMR